MARKPRDYKAEYAAAKRRATAQGFKSEREAKRARKDFKLAAWSAKNSHTPRSQYNPNWLPSAKRQYERTFVANDYAGMSKKARAKEKRRRLKEWLVPRFMTETEWAQKYPPL
jgi:hypothetical protein